MPVIPLTFEEAERLADDGKPGRTDFLEYVGVIHGIKEMQGELVQFSLLGPNQFLYEYRHRNQQITFEGQIERAGGRPDGNPALNHKQKTDNCEVRWEWLPDGHIKFEYWLPGDRAGLRENRAADASATLRKKN